MDKKENVDMSQGVIVKVGPGFDACVPEEMVEKMGWNAGDVISFSVLDTNTVVAQKATQEEIDDLTDFADR